MRLVRLAGSVALAVTLFLAGCSLSPEDDTAPITLGAVYNLSGGQAGLDVPSAHGAQLAIDEVNARGGVLGRPVELVLVDGETDPAILAAGTATLLAGHPDTSALFGLSDTDMVLAAAGEAAAAQRLFVTSGATSPRLPAQVPDYLYLACFGDNVQAAAAAEYAYNELQARSVAVLYRREDTYTELLQGYFTTRFSELGGAIVATAGYTTPDELAQAIATMPAADMVFFSAAPDDVIAGVSQMRAAGLTVPIVGGDGFDLGGVWNENPSLSGVYFTTHAFVDLATPDPAMATFIEAYAEAYPGEEAGAFAALGYDTARLLLAAIEQAGSAEPSAVLAALPAVGPFQGVTGDISYDNGSRIPDKSVAVLVVDSGQVALAAEITPSEVPAP